MPNARKGERVPEASPDPAVRCRGLVKRYGDLVAVDGIDLEVRAGECFGLLGPNGAGKTTTIEVLEGLLEPDGGEVEVLGMRWTDSPRELRHRLGIQLQETEFSEKHSVAETIRLFRSFYRRGRTVDEVVALVGLEEKADSWVGKLSGGQRQRLAAACSLVGDPDLLFLDEPTTGLDPHSRRALWEVIEAYRAGGGTVLLTTHYMEEAARLADRVGIMDRGEIIALGTPAGLVASLGADHVVEVSLAEPDGPAPEWSTIPGVEQVHAEGETVGLTVAEPHRAVPSILEAVGRVDAELAGLAVHHATLEDVFVALTGRHLEEADVEAVAAEIARGGSEGDTGA